jgi:cysteine desulfurase family protein (TIGR01976 family)
MSSRSLRHRFPGISDTWARFDGPAGTQTVDTAITAMAAWLASGSNACGGGYFAAALDADALVSRARASVGELLHADPAGVAFGANSTTNVFTFSRAIGRTLRPGDRIVGTALDHDSNITPWRLAAEAAGAEHVLAPFDPATGNLPAANVIALIDERTRWVTVPGASNLLGSVPDLAPIVEAAHAVGARVFVDAVHLAPHFPIDIAALGCDALTTSPYKWYGPHSGVIWIEPQLLGSLPVFKVRPSHDEGPERFETGMPNFEAIAGIEAAARFLVEEDMAGLAAAEAEVFEPLLTGLQAIAGVRVWGEQGMARRTPTAAFTVAGVHPSAAAKALADEHVAVWDGHNYAVEVVAQLGLADSGGVVRAGVSRYTSRDDVDRLLTVVRRLASGAAG